MKTIIAACVLLLSATTLACAGETSDDPTTTSPSAVSEVRPVRSATPGQIDREPAFAKGAAPRAGERVDVAEGAKAGAVGGERGSEVVGDEAKLRLPTASYGSELVGDATR